MHFRICTIIGATLLLASVQQASTDEEGCNRVQDLVEPCGCLISRETFDPVCGSDGHTYLNNCFLYCRSTMTDEIIKISHKGFCPGEEDCRCHPGYSPVCGSDGKTYTNDCVLKCHTHKNPLLKVKFMGPCDGGKLRSGLETINMACVCNTDNHPICASNGITYQNYCLMRCKTRMNNDFSVKFVHWGSCDSLPDYEDSRSYNDPEIPNLAKRQRPSEMQPTAMSRFTDHKCYCWSVHRPVCGSDDETYANTCVLYCKAKKKPNLTMKNKGVCHDHSKEPASETDSSLNMIVANTCFCWALNRPVCGTDGNTYANACVLFCHAKKKDNQQRQLQLGKWGPCGIHDIKLVKDKGRFLRHRVNNQDIKLFAF